MTCLPIVQLVCRVVGTAIQLWGLLDAAIGVNNSRESFGLPPLKPVAMWRQAFHWFKVNVLRRRGNLIAQPEPIDSGEFFGGGKLTMRASLDPLDRTLPVGEQVAIVDGNIRRVDAEVQGVEKLQRKDRERIQSAETKIVEVAEGLRRETDDKLRDEATKALSRQARGLGIAAAGTLIAAFG